MKWIGRAFGVAAALALGITAGCSADPSSSDAEPALASVPVVRDAAGLTLPLDAYRLSQRDYLSTQRAAWRLTRECVGRFGGRYTLPESAVVRGAPPDVGNSRRYGLFDESDAGDLGYNAPRGGAGADSTDDPGAKGAAGGWNPSEAELVLVRGTSDGGAPTPTDEQGRTLPAGGCSGEATRRLDAGTKPPADPNLADKLAVEAHQKAENDSRVRAAMQRWSTCMQQSGYTYRTIWEPNDARWPDPAGDAEITTAKADVACKQSSNLVGVWYAVEVARQKQVLDDRSQDLEAVRGYLTAVARNAATLAAGA